MEKVWCKEDVPLVEEDQVRESLSKLDIHQSMGPDRMHPQVLREIANVIMRPLLIIFDQSWQLGEMPKDCQKANVTCIFKKCKEKYPGNYRLVSPTSTSEKDGAMFFSVVPSGNGHKLKHRCFQTSGNISLM